ncbi:uncharacterized protein LOC129220026 [Uloborus diversus]|uniref:uncharacterized protein LOC129220026 n=1 Tax=Uloborus diversus TaxID=327109 RepID=UPI00240A0684|nr:uncharacterized protein LOC129220026 [Uloborus diversus]
MCLTWIDEFITRYIVPLAVKLKTIQFIFCLLFILCKLTSAQVFANECDLVSVDDVTGVVMSCRVRTLQRISDAAPVDFDVSRILSIFCDDFSYENIISNGTFSKFGNVQSLQIENCYVPNFPESSFWGLLNLVNLSVHLNKTSSKILKFKEEAFANLPKLQKLDLSYNNLIVLPANLFCGLQNLKVLNLTNCELDDARNIGLGSSETLKCLPELMILDLSYNILKSIPDGIFSSLVSLKILYLNNNQLSELYPYAFSGLSRLQSLDLSNNRISHLPEQIFQQSSDILELYLQNNSLSSLTPRVFEGLRQLVGLNLSYNSLENVVSSETLADLSRLFVLDLNHNRFQVVTVTNFHLIRSLQILYLSYNNIVNISDNSFSSLRNLHTLTLAGNRIRNVDANTFSGLESLNYLSLSNNEIEFINPNAFASCKSIQNLKLRSNKLTEFPKALNSLTFLKHIDLTHNQVYNISNNTFQGLKNIVSLHISKNHVGNMTKGCFQDLTSLKTLDLSYNKIQSLGHSLFDDVPELRVAKFNDNQLTDINGLFMNLRYLHTLNVSRNKITWFDYALVPTELKILDIHDNQIDKIGNYFELEQLMNLRNVDASRNLIRELNPASLPNSIETVSFRFNRITVIGPFTFMAKTNLTFVDLRGNAIRHLDINAFRLKSIAPNQPLPEFLLSNNTLTCDCSMEWLQRINNYDETRQYPLISDLGDVLCHVTFPRRNAVVPMSVTKASDFLCRYHSHCFALCHCCDFDACDCEMVCPENCTCYSDQTWNTNMVDCSLRGYSNVPHRIPMDVTDLYLDGNDMSHVSSHSLIGHKNLRVLHMNNSNIHIIRNRTFNGLQNLFVLHLENNHITVIEGHEFTNLTKLQELYLSHNRLKTIKNESFKHLNFLQILYLDHNHIIQFNVWNLKYNRALIKVKIGHNRWNCDCSFTEPFRYWFTKYKPIVVDGGSVRCTYNNFTTMHIIEFSNSSCSNFSVIPFTSAEFVEEYMSVVILVPMMLLMMLLIAFLVCKYRNNMKMWIYNKYGVKLFEKSEYPEDNEKLFDAFVSYCKKDEAFVTQMVSPELECGSPPQRLCLRYRDLPVSRYMAETISEAVECSFCSIAVVSEQYLKSEWCIFELKASHHETQCNKRHKLIIILLNKVEIKELEPDVRACFKAAIIVHWGDRRFWEKLRYALPEGRNNRHHMNCNDTKLSTTLRRSSLSNSIKLMECETVKLKTIQFIFCLLFILCKLTSAQVFANECDLVSVDDVTGVVMSCRVRTLQRISDAAPVDFDVSRILSIFCDDFSYENIISNGTFSKFGNVQSLQIENCYVPNFPESSFWGLLNLVNLSVHLNKTSSKILKFKEEAFANLPKLQKLDLSYNNLIVLPANLFCGLQNLKVLNLTNCELDDARNIGLGSSETLKCLPELMILDLSYNILKSIPDGIFSSLVSLKILYLNNNQLSELYPYAFSGLSRLQSLDLSNNRISHLPEQIFQQSSDILELYLQNNSLSSLTPRVFEGLRQLVGLNLSYNSLENVVSSETLADLSRLFVLDLNHNRFQVVTVTNFHLIRSLQILYLSYNNIVNISDNSFSSLRNLHTLTLAGNRIRNVDANTFSGLESLNYLSLSNNEIEFINPNAFASCKSIQNLKLRSNKLTEFPKALNSLTFLKHIDLTHNQVYNISNNTFQGLKNIVSLHISKNHVGNMTKGCFQDLTSLKTLDLSYNKIQSLGHSLFDDVPELRVAKFNDNQLTDINGLFMNLRYLHTLNVSRNKITWFDYALVPTELKILDIHDNQIDKIGNYFELEQLMNLRNVDASRNLIRELNPASLPNSIETVSFRFNRITVIGPFTFMAKTNLTFVDLRGNAIRHLDINAFRLKSIAPNQPLPEFLLSNNTLTCDCSMEWLQRINNYDETRQYPLISDLGDVLCHVTFPRRNAVVPMSVTKASDFLCRYHSHCFALCHCCDFDACDCEMVCPENCTCYSDQTWNTNMVDCSLRGYSNVPHRIPMDVTDLYLDGNDMSHVSSHSLIGHKNLRVLHMNNSNIHIIRNRTFNGLQNLFVLHLENNHITVIEGHEFTNLTKLQELYLSHNRLKTIKNESFKHLNFLQILYLDHNHIIQFNVWNLKYNRALIKVKIGHNRWNCDCSFTEPFRYWFTKFKPIVVDGGSVRCTYNNFTTMHIIEFSNSSCSNFSVIPFTSAEFVEEYMSVVILVPMMLLMMLLIAFLVCKYRNNMKMWIYNKYGVKLFEKSEYPEDNEKLFDAFVSYCKKDEAFVTQMVSPELECGSPPQRLCLRYRDLPVSRYMAETISEAVECSFCSIAVVSEQYLKSEWCIFELKASHHETQCNKRHKLIIILLNKVEIKELEPDVRACFKAAIIVHWGDRRFWEKLRYALPEGRNNRHHMNCNDTKLSTTLRRSSLSNSIKLV